MFSHITVGSNNLAKAEKFYNALLLPLNLKQRHVNPDGGPLSLCWVSAVTPLPRFYVYTPLDGAIARSGNGAMVAFLASSSDIVNKAYAAAIKAGGSCAGAPGPRTQYGDGYYGAYLHDTDGNKIHVAFRGDLTGYAMLS